MSYILVIIAFVAMGGPKPTTPTIDHVHFSTQANCESAKTVIAKAYGGARVQMTCLPE